MDSDTKIDIYAAQGYGEKYDAACKRLFGNKEILAPILKYTVREYRDSSMEDIIRYIDRDSISDIDPVGDVPVHMDGLDSEMSSVSDKLIRFDKRFRAAVPGTDEKLDCSLHFDLEIQNDYRPASPPCPVPKRAVYYVARELGAQLGSITEETDYSSLKKCYSIWICNENIPAKLQNTVTSYRMQAEQLAGNAGYDPDYDLMEVIMILRGKKHDDTPVLDYLQGVFSSDLETIEKHVDVRSSEKIVAEVKEMNGLGATIAKEVAKEKLQEGRVEGRVEGRIMVFKNMIRRGFDVKDAMSLAEITEEQAREALVQMGKKQPV